jgi:hypothetical protein
MPGPRQQRTNNARGTLPAGVVAYAPEITWEIGDASGSTVTLYLSIPAPLLVISGLPQFIRSFGNETPIAVAASGNHLLLTFPSPNNAGFTLTLGQRDPAVRTAQGGFLAPGVGVFEGPAQTTVAVVADEGRIVTQVAIFLGAPSGRCFLPSSPPLGTTVWVVADTACTPLVNVWQDGGGAPLAQVFAPGQTQFVWDTITWSVVP